MYTTTNNTGFSVHVWCILSAYNAFFFDEEVNIWLMYVTYIHLTPQCNVSIISMRNISCFDDIIKMLEFLVDNIFVVFAGKIFQQTVGIPMGTNCAPLLADIFLYSYEADFIQSLLSTGKKHLASRFNLTYRYIDDVLSINNPEFENYLGQMYPAQLEIKDTTESNTSTSYLDLLLSIWRDGQLHTSIYDKRDDFNFHIINFPFLSSNIPSSPAYGDFISQLIRYARACSWYECFILRARRLSSKLLKQG